MLIVGVVDWVPSGGVEDVASAYSVGDDGRLLDGLLVLYLYPILVVVFGGIDIVDIVSCSRVFI